MPEATITTTAPPAGAAPAGGAPANTPVEPQLDTPGAGDAPGDKPEGEPKKEPTPEQRELRRLQRNNARLLQQRAELRARLNTGGDAQQLTREPQRADNRATPSDNETLSLSRQELQAMIDKEARKLAPQIKQQEAEMEHRSAIVDRLAKDLGQEKFDALASDLDDAFGGLTDEANRPKPAVDAIFESEDTRSLIEYLADPDHADEAEAIGRMSAVQAGRAITKLEMKLAEKKAKDKPQPSKAAAPIEPVRGAGTVNGLPSDSDDVNTWIKKERARLEAKRKGAA